MSKSKLEISKESGAHQRFLSLVGNWDGTTSTWFEKDVLADESPTMLSITSVLEGRFISFDYRGSLNKKAFEGKMLWAYDLGNNKCQCSWIDSFHMGTGILFSEGAETANGFSVLGSYGGPGIPEPWGWRTELEIINSGQFILRAYNISPQGDEAKATESIFYRVVL